MKKCCLSKRFSGFAGGGLRGALLRMEKAEQVPARCGESKAELEMEAEKKWVKL